MRENIGAVIKVLLFIALLIIFGTLIPCKAEIIAASNDTVRFDFRDFYTDNYNVILCFDLRNDVDPIAGLVIKSSSSQLPRQHFVALPFGSTSVSPNETLFATSGSYKDFTIINYIFSSRSGGPTGIGMIPIFDPSPQTPYSVDDLTGSLYLIRDGLERRFIYVYPTSESGMGVLPPEIQKILTDTPDAIAIAIPNAAVRKEIRLGQTEIPARIFSNKIAAYYPASSIQPRLLEVRYEVPPSTEQKLVLEYGIKIVAAILTPLLGLLFLSSGKITRAKSIILFIGLILEIIILIIVFKVAFIVKGESELKTKLDFLVVIIGALFTTIALWIKARGEQRPKVNP